MDGIGRVSQLTVRWQHLGRLRFSAGMVILILRMRPLIKLFLRSRRGINSTLICSLINLIDYSLLPLSTGAVPTSYSSDLIMKDWDDVEVRKA